MTKEEIAVVFEEWKIRYDANPEGFWTCGQVDAEPPKTYGEACARYFLWLVEDLGKE